MITMMGAPYALEQPQVDEGRAYVLEAAQADGVHSLMQDIDRLAKPGNTSAR